MTMLTFPQKPRLTVYIVFRETFTTVLFCDFTHLVNCQAKMTGTKWAPFPLLNIIWLSQPFVAPGTLPKKLRLGIEVGIGRATAPRAFAILSKYARIPPSSAGGMNGLPSPLGGEGLPRGVI